MLIVNHMTFKPKRVDEIQNVRELSNYLFSMYARLVCQKNIQPSTIIHDMSPPPKKKKKTNPKLIKKQIKN